ncbi:uncharacterized protein LOC132381084 isoform X2 [Hypanus sabinus]|uniref:uncharacterized protein LOC132381084 isoform X2 n=1 Tax=Hypanus sabinus TaxID=79690 RepID=UPI0028C43897|nr:uncharacterized protein LOC132381084 isoform X2 [Hypanus sabinus]
MAVVIADSVVRGTDRQFCGCRKETQMVICLPGARVRDVSDRVHNILKWEGEQPEVMVHIGTNDIVLVRADQKQCNVNPPCLLLSSSRGRRQLFTRLLLRSADADSNSSLWEIIGIELYPEDLSTYCFQPDRRTCHRKYTVPFTAETKKLLYANNDRISALGNTARVSRVAARLLRRMMSFKQCPIATKRPRIKVVKLSSTFPTRNKDLHLSSTFNMHKHPKVFHRYFIRKKFCTAAKKFMENGMKNYESNHTSAIVTKNPGAPTIRNTSKSSRMAKTRSSLVTPTRSNWVAAIKNTDGSLVAVPRLNITKKRSATVIANPGRIIPVNPVVNATQVPGAATNQNPLTIAAGNPRMTTGSSLKVAAGNLKMTTGRNLKMTPGNPGVTTGSDFLSVAIKNDNILIKTDTNQSPSNIKNRYTVTIRHPNKSAIQKPSRSNSGSTRRVSNQPSKMITVKSPRGKVTKEVNGILNQKLSRIDIKITAGP